MSGDIRDVVGGNGLSASTSNGIVTLDINVDNTTIAFTGDSIQVKDGGITTTKINNLSTDIVTNNSSTAIPTAAAVKAYVDSATGGLGNLEGGWDVSLNMSFPTAMSPNTVKKGDYWYATSAGTFYVMGGASVTVEIGDVFIAKFDNAASNSEPDWIILQVNKDQATETTLGLVRIADQSTVNAGIDDQEAITTLKLKTYLDSRTGGFSQDIGDGINTSFIVNHNLGTKLIVVVLYDTFTGEEVIADVINNDMMSNSITVNFATAPAYLSIRVVIKK
jgi:hypothetical protein